MMMMTMMLNYEF